MSTSRLFECFIEISKHSNIKYELTNNKLMLDRILFGSMVYPQNYGFITETLGEDGDPLDVVLISNFSLEPGSYAIGRVIGALEMVDDGENDLKVIAVMEKDIRLSHIDSMDKLPNSYLDELKNFFEEYKKLEKKEVKLGKVLSLDITLKLIEEAEVRYNTHS